MEIGKLRRTVVFQGMDERELLSALSCLQAMEKKVPKGERILQAGEPSEWMGLVLEGSVTIESNDMWGNRTLLSKVGPMGFFAESYAVLEGKPLLVDVMANEESTLLLLRIGGIQRVLSYKGSWTVKLVRNLLCLSAQKNLVLSGRSFHTAPKSIRGRVMAYLNSVSLQKGSREFEIPFDRQQLADYLNVERSALSKELGRMKREGLIETHKNHFLVLGGEEA